MAEQATANPFRLLCGVQLTPESVAGVNLAAVGPPATSFVPSADEATAAGGMPGLGRPITPESVEV